jgi:NAD-dependent SIR2 family protein deacetylase
MRSYAGWPTVNSALPSAAHLALTRLQNHNDIPLIVTQNVDRLHQRGGSANVIDLHGRLDEVVCLSCSSIYSREFIQAELLRLNPFLSDKGQLAPDGDAEVADDLQDLVEVPECQNCQGMLKPNVVFFGANVEKTLVEQIYSAIAGSDGLLIIGSSLKVFSGYRFCRYAWDKSKPIVSINPGVTRGDELIGLRLATNTDALLTSVAATLSLSAE